MNRRPLGTKLSQAILGFQQFKTAEALSPGTLVSYDCALRLWLSHVGDVDLKEITTSSVLEYLARLRVEYKLRRLSGREGSLSPKTIRNAYAILSTFFKWAIKKLKWYFAGVPAGGFRQFDMDEIRARYGSQRVVTRSAYPMEEADAT